ncbi:histidine kinase [Sorangium cellulosum]|uniref:histidine kinase n=1 Tax=Sorangium cellulosum TaxID=56 RepID=A0A2L0F0N7_SORCE|nr:ATP-binding protein [Sorangium cellulosum]AUX45029.1 histidine kinase [Sorangium cellulosum]
MSRVEAAGAGRGLDPAGAALSGGGEMGALIRSIDWSRTSLGPVEAWPPSLRTALSILLSSEHPMFLWWGRDLIQFYNDGYRPILGSTKHPAAMGQEGRACWKEIWDVIGPMIEKVFSGGATYLRDGLLILDRNGFLEECYFNYGYSPIRDESGAVAGVFVACSESTGHILGQRRLQLLGALAARAADARNLKDACRVAMEALADAGSDLPFALLYLADDDGAQASLAGTAGLDPDHAAAPAAVSLEPAAGGGVWPLHRALREEVEVDLSELPPGAGALPGGPWPDPARRAVVLPIPRAGAGVGARPAGFLVAGVSPRLVLDDDYRAFLRLVAGHCAMVLQNARASEEEQRRLAALAELDRAKTAFFSNVSHEFRTPLTLILGPAEDGLADAEQPLPPRQRERLELVHRNSLRLLRLVNTLLDFSRIEAGRIQAHYQPTDLGTFTGDLASSFRSLLERAGLSLTVACPPLSEPAYVDRDLWEKIVLNLVSNAFKFTFAGGVRVSLEEAGGRAVLSVADTGTGIPEAELPHLFERFHRVEGLRGRSYEGSGIGLALVQELARLHGGSVAVESRFGEGSRFSVSIPLGKAHLPEDHVAPASAPASTGRGAAPFLDEAAQWVRGAQGPAAQDGPEAGEGPAVKVPGHILVADDNADMREYLQRLLVAQGWRVEAVADGHSALERARAHAPDLVLTDVMMPGLDGFGLLGALRADEHTRGVAVMMLSARAGEASRVESLEAGADDFLVKPFSAKELLARVRVHVELARRRREAEGQRQYLNDLFMQAPGPIAILRGPEHVFEVVNPLYQQLVGGRALVGKPIRAALPELEGQRVWGLLDQVYRTGEPVVGKEFPVRLDRQGSGATEEVFFNFVYQPMRDRDGAVEGIFVFAFEVTDQVNARRSVEALVKALQLADQRKDEFLAMLAHELRNPMASISMSLSLLEALEGDGPKSARYREIARRQMGHLVRIVDDLLDVSRITRGTVELRVEEIDLAAVVQGAVAAVRPAVQARQHELSLSVGAGDFRMRADATRLEQVVTNLLTNAAKYTAPGGMISARLTREAGGGAPEAVLRVRDTGRGIPAAMLEKVFDLFTQVDQTIDRSTGGLGLGLTLVRRLLALHGGSVMAASDGPGRGSEFTVRLPLGGGAAEAAAPRAEALTPRAEALTPRAEALTPRAEAPAPSAEAVAPRAEAAASPPRRAAPRRRVLVVEDAEDVRRVMREFIEALGHEVTVAVDGLEGVAKLLSLRPEVAFVDIGLPGIDGHEVARRARAAPGGERLYLVALSGYGGPEAQASAERAGFDLHLTKPVGVARLQQALAGRRG